MNSFDPVFNQLIAANNDFGFRLLSQLIQRKPTKNIFVSPFSLAIALTMVYNGAEGTTKQAMAETLGLKGLDLQEVNEAYAVLRAIQSSFDPKVQLSIANSLWAQKALAFKPDFIQRNKEIYGAEVTNLDFTEPSALTTINGWVRKKTQGKINDLVKPADLDALTALILINAIYFKGKWRVQFEQEKTQAGIFTLLDGNRQPHPMMSQMEYFEYYEDKTLQAVSLPYGDGRLSMYIILPYQHIPFREFQNSLTAKNWQKWRSKFRRMEGELVLPRLKVEYEVEFSAVLATLGMSIAFGPDADFRSMCPKPLWISKVRHKTYLEVNEEGTEAAAATVVVMLRLSLPEKFHMVVDRPFFCAICDNDTGALLFIGFILEPNLK